MGFTHAGDGAMKSSRPRLRVTILRPEAALTLEGASLDGRESLVGGKSQAGNTLRTREEFPPGRARGTRGGKP